MLCIPFVSGLFNKSVNSNLNSFGKIFPVQDFVSIKPSSQSLLLHFPSFVIIFALHIVHLCLFPSSSAIQTSQKI